MNNIKVENLNWNQRFALIEGFDLADDETITMLKVNPKELKMAKRLRKESGLFDSDPYIDLEMFRPLLEAIRGTDKPKPAAKRGRKTHKIKDAYEAIPYDKVPVEEFMKEHDVSLSVLRRHKHFDHKPELGKVNVRKYELVHGGEKILCIWRTKP